MCDYHDDSSIGRRQVLRGGIAASALAVPF